MAKKAVSKTANKKAARKAPKRATTTALTDLVAGLLAGKVKMIDLIATLGPDTPLIKLPPEIGLNTPKIEAHEISHDNSNGPFWAWNWLKLGKHSGTHFDAPAHWITGKDYKDGTTDRIPPKNFVAPVCVIDCGKEVKKSPDFLLTVDHVKSWEAAHGVIPNAPYPAMT